MSLFTVGPFYVIGEMLPQIVLVRLIFQIFFLVSIRVNATVKRHDILLSVIPVHDTIREKTPPCLDTVEKNEGISGIYGKNALRLVRMAVAMALLLVVRNSDVPDAGCYSSGW